MTKYQKFNLAIFWLVFASLFFYAWWNPKYLVLLLLSITVNYGLGYLLWKRSQENKKNTVPLFFGIFVNLLFIGYFKYAYFLISNINQVIDKPFDFGPIILPLGISFFTFQKIAFLVDASRGEIKKYRFLDYCLFVTFFPQLIAGPIVQHKQVIPQFSLINKLKVSAENFNIGMTIFFIGLFKKIALADSIAVYANAGFDGAAEGIVLSFWEAWGATFAYALQLYFDFSGYSDMAIGLGFLFGIKLPINFFSPYKAKSIIEFWHRWHMTLSRFLRDYLYIPLGGNRKGSYRRFINLMITMLLGGLWHGANWTFLMWGGLHGLFLIINHIWQWLCCGSQFLSFCKKRWFSYISHFLTLLAVVLAWVPFRADNMSVAKSMLKSMLTLDTFSLPHKIVGGIHNKGMFYNGLAKWEFGIVWIGFLLTITLLMPNTTQLMNRFAGLIENLRLINPTCKFISWKPSRLWAAIMSMIFLISLILISDESEFLYFQF